MKYFSRTLYTSPVYYGLCLSDKEYQRELKRLKVKKESAAYFVSRGHAMTHIFDGTKGAVTCLVCIHPSSVYRMPRAQIYGLLVHEATHVFQEMMRVMGERNPSDEFMAYSIQAISVNLIASFDKQDKKYNARKTKVNIPVSGPELPVSRRG